MLKEDEGCVMRESRKTEIKIKITIKKDSSRDS
jgi:hypothetical protein